jgi:putative membrane protein
MWPPPTAPSACASLERAEVTRIKWLGYAATLALLAATWIRPIWPLEQAMHGSLEVVALLWLLWHQRRWPMRDSHFLAICVFLCVHSLAARWLYSNVPYDAWLRHAFGWSPNDAFGWRRNHADRLIHFLYGLCFAPALRDWLARRWPGLSWRHAFALAVMLIMCSSLLYEWLEWAIALLMSPEAAESYNGQQGDVWDAHADMLLATLGALLTWPSRRRTPA